MRRITLLCALFLCTSCALAQDPVTGFPPYGSFETSPFDAVNRQNLNANFSIPIVSSQGRGLNFSFPIIYDLLVWRKVTVGSTTSWTPVTNASGNPAWGWKTNLPFGAVTFASTLQSCLYIDDFGILQTEYTTRYDKYRYIDPAGTIHPFFFVSWYSEATHCHWQTPVGSAGITGTAFPGITYAVESNELTVPDGTEFSGSALTDTNGNSLAIVYVNSTETDIKDTVGRTALKMIKSGSNLQYQFLDPTGNYQTATLVFGSFSVKTNFGCSGVVEYTNSATLPTEFDLPNGQKYLFTYESYVSGSSTFYTGRLKRITLPTGGYYEYQYPTTGNKGIVCADATVNSLTRVTNDGTNTSTWQFSRAQNGSNWNTTVTAPQLPYDTAANQSVFTFTSSGQEITEKFYQGAAAGTPLRTVNITWAANGTPATRTTILEDNSTRNQVETAFDSNGNLLTLKEHDWGTGSPGSIKRTTTWTYLTGSSYTAKNILNRVTQIVVRDGDGSGPVKSRTDIAYDEASYINFACVTGAVQHDDTNYGCTYTTRGSPTTITTYTDPVTPAGATAKHLYYDSLGNVVKADVNCCQQEQWNYSVTTQYAYPDSVLRGTSPTQLTSSATYNAYTGLVATSTDENGKVTTFTYDTMKRLVDVQRPDNAHLTWSFNDAVPPAQSSVTAAVPVQGTDKQKQTITFDGLGRPFKQQTTDAGGASYSISQVQYDSLGRPYKSSNPHNSTPQYWTETRFEGLGRPTLVIPPDGTPTSNRTVYSYSANTATVTDPTGKARKSLVDGLGRLATVYEPDVANGNQLTQQTSYAYNVFDRLLTVTQGSQTRTYAYDALSRLTDATTPEAGHFQYQYNSFSLLTQRTDTRGVITTYGYDTLNRLTSTSYNVGSTGVPATASVTLTYGTSSAQNNNGRLLTVTDGPGSETYSYDNLGQVTQLQKVISGTTYTTSYAYNLAGELSSITYPSGRVVQQAYDTIGRLCTVGNSGATCSSGTTFASGFAYNTAFQVTGFSYGNGVAAAFGYSPDRLQLTSLAYTKNTTTLLNLAYGYTQNGGNNGQITSITDNTGTQEAGRSVTYTYDALYRLSTAVTTGSTNYAKWGLSWTYDRYGNRLNQAQTYDAPPANSVTVSATTNRITDPGYSYDTNGNMTNDGLNALTYDAENRAITSATGGTTTTYTYDGSGLRLKKQVGAGTATVYIFSGSKVVAEYVAGAPVNSPQREYIYTGSQLVATIEGSTTKYHQSDHLSLRVTTDSNGVKVADSGHYPYGESWYETGGANKLKFTSYARDNGTGESGNDYAMFRYAVNRLGRFSSPDPLAGSISDPQSLNRYAYTRNDPTNLIDPLGLMCLTFGFWEIWGDPVTGEIWYTVWDPTFTVCDPKQGGGGGGRGGRARLNDRNQRRFDKAQQNALKGLFNPDCMKFLGEHGINIIELALTIQIQTPWDGTKSTISVYDSNVFTFADEGNWTPRGIATNRGTPVARRFQNSPGTQAMADAYGRDAYYRAGGFFGSGGIKPGNIFHEALHQVTHLGDEDLAKKLGAGSKSEDINPALEAHNCI